MFRKSVTSTGSTKKTIGSKQHNQTDLVSETNSVESSPASTPIHQMRNEITMNVASFNSMDLPSPSNRNLSEKELRDCDVIGTCVVVLINFLSFF